MVRVLLLLAAVAFATSGCAGPAQPLSVHVAEVAWVSVPATAEPGAMVEVCWRLAGTGRTGHTDVHHDVDALPDDPRYEPANATFPDNMGQAAENGYAVPGNYCAFVRMPSEGALHVRAHAAGASEADGRLSVQRTIQVE